ncbi:MAG: cytochrome c [Gammaproteobacteria bacterium]|nr:cytochrome c [Gammaproteobacteria bacterium]
MKKIKMVFMLSVLTLFLSACGNEEKEAVKNKQTEQRWYTKAQVTEGAGLYRSNCAMCHKVDASGTHNWKEPLANGKYPPPPLNGDAHAWHHSLAALKRTIKKGGVALGGTMPAFGNRLNDAQIEAILAWVQTHWSDRIYQTWSQRNAQNGKMMPMMNRP